MPGWGWFIIAGLVIGIILSLGYVLCAISSECSREEEREAEKYGKE